MDIIFDWIFIFIGLFCFVKAYQGAFSSSQKNKTACFVQIVIFAFNCLPIILDYVFGKPSFNTIYWWRSMGESMAKQGVCIIYDMYISLAMLFIHFFNIRMRNRVSLAAKQELFISKNFIVNKKGKSTRWPFDNKIILVICVLSPIISMIISGNWRLYLTYGTTQVRGISENFSLFSMNNLLILSLWAFCLLFLRKEINIRRMLILLIYSFALAWISGKRYIIADMIIMYMFFYVQLSTYNQKNERFIKKMMLIAVPFLAIFSIIYLISFKGSTLLTISNFSAIYETLRADFGRDGVIKFVIDQEFFKNKSIVDYPGASFLSAFFVWVPREIWTAKPYQHFIYLTAAIKNVSINNVGAGITPSWYEMSIANFKFLGFVIGVIVIPLLCKWADGINSIEMKSILLMLIIVLLTQSIDAYIMYIAVLMISSVFVLFTQKLRNIKKIRRL